MNNDLEYAHTDHPLRHYDQTCAACEIESLRQRITELDAVIKSHGIPVKSMSGGVAHYCTGEEK